MYSVAAHWQGLEQMHWNRSERLPNGRREFVEGRPRLLVVVEHGDVGDSIARLPPPYAERAGGAELPDDPFGSGWELILPGRYK